MTKWIAKINENDELFGEEILLGVEGGETGFEIVLSNGDDSDVMPGMSKISFGVPDSLAKKSGIR